jgi:gas vesicle protein
MASERLPVVAGLLTGALIGASLALVLTPSEPSTRERLRALARQAQIAPLEA